MAKIETLGTLCCQFIYLFTSGLLGFSISKWPARLIDYKMTSVHGKFIFPVWTVVSIFSTSFHQHRTVDVRTNCYLHAGGRCLSVCLFDLTFNLNAKPKSFCISDHFPFIMPKTLLRVSAVFGVNDHDILKMVTL